MKTFNHRFGVLAFLHWDHEWNHFHFKGHLLEKAIQKIKDLGSPMVRMDILWSDVEREGKFDFSRYDRIVSILRNHKIDSLALLQYNKYDLSHQHHGLWNKAPADHEEFAAYVHKTVSHFKSHIKHWEIWNEPNHPVYWIEPQDNLKTYCNLLKVSYKAAKKANPHCVVLNGGLTEPLLEDVGHLYAHGAKSYTDILNVHTFINPIQKNAIGHFHSLLEGIRAIMEKYGDSKKKIWITEMGCPGVPNGKPMVPWFAGEPTDEKVQADWLEKIFLHVKNESRVEKLFWAFFRDTDGEFKDATDHLGLLRFDLSPKPAYHQMKQLIDQETR